ncbi:hypothetical protein [Nocardia salmonicida]|uniref:hypothetical protein n=1 Tax=Nocardia salmonicida TaxID=53431 RepID=UPI00379EA435
MTEPRPGYTPGSHEQYPGQHPYPQQSPWPTPAHTQGAAHHLVPPHGQPGFAHPMPGPVAPRPPSGSGKILAACLAAIAVAVVVIVVAVLTISGGDDPSRQAGPPSSSAVTPTGPSSYDRLDKSGRAFPTLLPQGASGPRKTGPAYQNAECTAKSTKDYHKLEIQPMASSPWVLLWDCKKDLKAAQNPGLAQDYMILVYDTAADAQAVVSSLPAHTPEPGTKDRKTYTSHEWTVPGDVAPGGIVPYHTVNKVVSFENDPERANYLLFISIWGTSGDRLPSGEVQTAPPYAQDKVRAWWDAAAL